MAGVRVYAWDHFIGSVIWSPSREVATFEFDQEFVKLSIDLAPITMPLEDLQRGERIFEFTTLTKGVFHGLPGLLSDALPDDFGNEVMNAWVIRQGKDLKSITPVEKLSYIGSRGMGALQFEPAMINPSKTTEKLEVGELLSLTNKVLANKKAVKLNLRSNEERVLTELIKVGSSAGGQRAKAIIAYNKKTGEVRSGQLNLPKDFEHYILKFDGVQSGYLSEPVGYGRIELAYHYIATACGITMTHCELYEENGRAHFMTKRFDRGENGERIHMQTLCAMSHYDFKRAGAYSYDDAFADMRELYLPYQDMEQLYRRMVFNVIARNQDDHTKNISFLLPEHGEWRLSPAYDVTYSYNPSGEWTSAHQMNIAGKTDNFTKKDLLDFGDRQGIKNSKDIIEQILEVVSKWPSYAKDAGVKKSQITPRAKTHRLRLDGSL